MKAAEYLALALEQLDTQYVFGLPGSTEAPFLDAMVEPRQFEYILTLHENVTVAMADGYARGSGKPGIINLHTSVGTANGISQLYNAYRDQSPLVVLAGHKSTEIFNREGFCVVESLPEMARPVCKWSRELNQPEQVIDDFYRAVKIALSPPYGPVFLSLPENLMGKTLEKAPNLDASGRVFQLDSRPNSAELKKTAELLQQAKHPVIVAGDQVDKYGAVSVLSELAVQLGAVVLREPRRSLTRFTVSSDHPHFAGEYRLNHPAVTEADCIFMVGCKVFLEFSMPKSPEIPDQVPFIHLHDDPKEIAKIYPVSIGLLGDTRSALEELLQHGERKPADWAVSHKQRYAAELEQESRNVASGFPMSVTEMVKVLSDHLPSDIIIVDEGIRSSRPLVRHFPFREPNSFHTTSGGSLGWGLPAAVGLQLAQPERRVLAFVGDGSALFTMQALWTAARYNVPAIFLIVNNGGYLAVKAAIHEFRGQGANQQNYPASYIHSPAVDYVRLAEGYGVKGNSVTNKEQLAAALQEALRVNEPRLIEVRVAEEAV